MDFIKQLGEVAFGTRLRMLTDKFFQDGAKLYSSQKVDFEPRWFTIFFLLSQRSPLTITEITSELSYTQPAVTQIINILIKKGLVKAIKDKSDIRKKLIALSPKGQKLLTELKPIWQGFEDAVKELFTEIGYDLIYVVSKTENALEKRDMFERVSEKIKEKQLGKVEIISYSPQFKDKFKELNYEWLEKYFCVEPEDKKLLFNPESEIISKGGDVIFAKFNNEIVGTAALIKSAEGVFELTKMAVTQNAQGRQIGKKLAEEIIKLAKAKNADIIYLETNVKLVAAMNLYTKLGFELTENNNSNYARSTIKMKLKLS
ncbi:MAG: bifunctional helix-turn-helix transcriptional regulator/GNAT family N-acetyltransferase [Ignavibacteria bacterium]|nr:bifunctional helix-turn-helix transcriptional regulator/GNAT family N-acetyltransferase [Ignavibacteria bacterium]